MKAKILIVFALTVLIACNKDKYSTTPQLSFKKFSNNVIPVGGGFEATIHFTDKEGDIGSKFYVKRISRICPTTAGINFTDSNKAVIPDFNTSRNLEGDFLISFSRIVGGNSFYLANCSGKNDTSLFKIWVKDFAGNVSDTLVTPEFVLLK